MPTVTALMPEGRQRYFNNDGTPAAGALLYTYAAGTTNPKTAYTDPDGTTPHPNPITLDAKGEAAIFWNGAYKVNLVQQNGQQVTGYPVDNLRTDPAGIWGVLAQLVGNAGATLVGFLHKAKGAILRTTGDKLNDVLSLADFGSGIGEGDAAKDTAAVLAMLAAIKKDYYNKGGLCIDIPIPDVPYRLTQTFDLTECWNVTIRCGSALGFQRQQVLDPASDNALFHWYGAANGVMFRLHYTFGMEGERLSLNGRGGAKIGVAILPSVSGASVTRKVDLVAPVVKNCDFGIVVGDLTAQTDNAPVNIDRPHVSGCTSAAVLVNSGNAAVNISDTFFINNGYAPTAGNSFIADAANRGAHLNIVAGFVGVTNWTSDTDTDHPLAGAAIVQGSGSLRVNGAWCDDPTKPFYSGFADRPIYFNGVTHYDASMTLAGTPNSIEHSGPQPLVLESCYLYGNVSITSGNQASVIDLGTRFLRAGAGFTGNMVTTYGGLLRAGRTENNAVGLAVGGDFPTSVFGPYHSMTVWSDHNRTGLVRAARNGGYMISECINSVNGQLFVMGNARFDADSGQYKAIAPGPCWRHSYGKNSETFDSYQAANAGEVIATWANVHGFLAGVGPNAISILSLSGQKMTWDSTAPTVGTWSKGDICWNLNATVGQPQGWRCTVAGTPGTWVAMANI